MQGKERDDAQEAIASMIARSEKGQAKFGPGSSQHTLLKNRMHALHVAMSLLKREKPPVVEDLEKARAPIVSLISKSEKAREKLPADTWQHTMLSENLNALYLTRRLLEEALE